MPGSDGGADAVSDVGSTVGADGGPTEAGLDAGTDAPLAPSNAGRIFVTSTKFDGALGGVSGADMRCKTLAGARGLPGVYRAWLSSSVSSVLDRITSSGPWYRIGGNVVVFPTRESLTTGPSAAILFDERGVSALDDPRVWTGTKPTGAPSPFTCDNWSFANGVGTTGRADVSTSAWTQDVIGPVDCSGLARLICLRAD